jgi:hypothetical protein
MGANVSWLVENRVVYARVNHSLTLHDIDRLGEDVQSLARTSNEIVYDILDMREMDQFLTSLKDIVQLAGYLRAENTGYIVMVTDNPTARFMVGMASKIAGAPFSVFDTLSEALTFLNNTDSSLPSLKKRFAGV